MKYWYWPALVLVLLLAALQAKLWRGDGGLSDLRLVEHAIERQQAENRSAAQRNQALAADVANLKHGEEAVEARARDNLGLIKPGEVFYRFIDPDAERRPEAPAAKPKP